MNPDFSKDNHGNSRPRRQRQRSHQKIAQATTTNSAQSTEETPFFNNEAFPPLLSATPMQTTTNASTLIREQPTASSIYVQQPWIPVLDYNLQSGSGQIYQSIQPIIPVTQLSSRTETIKKSNRNEKFPVTGSKQPMTTLSHYMPGSNPTTTTASHLPPSVTMKSDVVSDNNLSSSTSQPLTAREQEVNKKICEIILTIHESKEFVSRERVQGELFDYFKVRSWNDLRVYASKFNALINLTDRQKAVIFYLKVFEQTFNLCTLHDLDSLLAKFLKVEKYEDLRLGPLDKNPEVQRVFDYEPSTIDQPIPKITTGEVIKKFMEFQKAHRRQRIVPFEEFLDYLVKAYELQTPKELGIFCKSFPYLVQVSGNVRRDYEWHEQQDKAMAQQELINDANARLAEFRVKLSDEMALSSFNKKKTPLAVFNYLTSIVDKYLDFVSQQPVLYAALIQLRDNELIQCLFNVSIYLGTLENPEVFVAELKKLYGCQDNHSYTPETMMQQQLLVTTDKMSKKDRRKINSMIEQQQQQQQTQLQSSSTFPDGQTASGNTTSTMAGNTSFIDSLLTSHQRKPKPVISLKQLCSDIYALLIRYDTVLSIKDFLRVDKRLCSQHSVANFSVFAYDENESEDDPPNLISFLHKYHEIIDPRGELSVYEQATSVDDRAELFSFIHQLSVINDGIMNEEQQQQHVTVISGHLNAEQVPISPEKVSAVEKAVTHKFGGLIGCRNGNQIIKKAKQRSRKNNYSSIHFEESLLDINGLNRLNICPTSLNVDEAQLCQLILHCPLMTDLHTWLQWLYFFQPKYGTLKSFIAKHQHEFKDLRLLETSTREVFRLPINATLASFENALNTMHVRSAVGHLCALMVQEGLVTRFSYNVYRTSMDTWFRQLRSLATLRSDHINPMQCILDFLIYLPVHIGQSRIVQELVLEPLDEVFGDGVDNVTNARTRIWNLADAKQKTKLELWGHTINIVEWRNEKKWLGQEDLDEKSIIKSENELIRTQTIDQVFSAASITTATESASVSTPHPTSIIPTTPTEIHFNDDNDAARAAFEHIELIRRGFGVDSGLDSTSQLVVTNLQGKLERSLEKLSNDLYSDQGHFVLELIQNADDNQYALDRVPTLRFILSPGRILVCNNETGFQSNNISAICDVGASTKGKHKQGYAGHKGIGFKSVFMVSHRPEIHSRNYHLCFDTVNGTQQIGYIRPIWLDRYEEVLPNADEWTTCIRLPIKEESRGNPPQKKFDHIQARLLLFLNRLRKIEIINQQANSSTNDTSRVFTRIDHAQGQIIELQENTTNGTDINKLWLVVKKVIAVPAHLKMKLRDVKGDVDSTTIAIACPLNGLLELSSQLPETQPLFAYLPLRSYGFRFILQADFEIPANRQEILRDNLWNDWLKSEEMTHLLYLAYLQFQRLPDLLASSSISTQISDQLTPIQTIKYFLKLIPSSRDGFDSYFKTFVDTSIQSLMGVIKLPITRQNEKEETVIDWVSPSQCVIVRDPFIRKIVSQDLLLSHFNSYYVHEQLVLECDEQILVKLGCRQLEFSDITRLIEASYKQDDQEHPKTTSSIEQIAQWLVCLDYSLQQEHMQFGSDEDEKRETETLNKLKQMKIIPLTQTSRLVSISDYDENAILFPLDKSIPYSKHLKLVLDDLPILDEQLLNFIEDKHPRRLDSIKKLLQKLGISKSLNIRDIYRQHILPIMSDPARWPKKSESVLIAYLLCIYQYIYLPNRDQFENELKQLQNKMIIKTRDNKFVSLGSPDVVVHLTSTYGSTRSLEQLRSSNYQFTFISDDYYTQCRANIFRTENDKYDFIAFLKDLNLNDFLQVYSIDKPFVNVSQLTGTDWAYLSTQLSDSIHEPFIIKDFRCDEFNKLVSSSNENQTADLELCVQLLQYLDKHHRSISMYYSASVYLARGYKYGQVSSVMGIESSFCLSLRQQTWIPIVGGKLFKPADVYLLPTNSETSAFGRYVPHLDETKVSLKNPDFISNILGIKLQVTPRTMFELLMKWSCNLDRESLWDLVNQTSTSDIIPCTLPNTFRPSCLDTIENFRQIYHFLASNDETRTLLNRFRLWPLLFIPRDQKTGDFLFVHQTFWNDPISLLSLQDTIADSNGRIPIRSYYDNDSILQSFFLDILHVQLQPTIDDYLPLLSTVHDHDKIWQIIEIITKLAVDQNKEKEVREKCLDVAFIPCMANTQKLMKYTDHPFYPHDTEISNRFADTLPIIKLPNFTVPTGFQEHFCSLFSIENLSKVIQTKVDVENEQPSTSLTDFYSRSIDLIQNSLLRQGLIPDARSIHLSTIFTRMHFVCVDSIHLSYCYGTNITKSAPTSYSVDTYIDEQSGTFYILKKYEASEMRYIDAMTEFIVEDEMVRSKLSLFIKRLLQIYQKEGEQGLTKIRESLTENYEPKWIIPEEIKKEDPTLSPIQEEEKTVAKKPVISDEELAKLMSEPSLRPKPKPKEPTDEEDANRMTSFPSRAGAIESNATSATKLAPKAHTKLNSNDSAEREHTSTSSTSNTNDQHYRTSKDRVQENNEHVVPRSGSSQHNNDANKNESNENETKPSNDQFIQPQAPIVFSDPTSLPPANFERIVVSTLTDLDLSTSTPSADEESTAAPFRPIVTEADLVTGRQGEEFVFQYLKWQYPDEDITWINQKEESGGPFDILRMIKSENNREEFIEVKTTRSYDQNTFPVSIGEVEYLLKYPSNYYIYRLYYADNKASSTITVINKVKENLKLKHLKLSMTVVTKPSD